MSVRGSSTSDSACNLQACVQLWPCTEPCSLDLSLYHFTPCITDSVFGSPDLMVLLLQAHWSSAPLNSTCCSCHNRDVIHCHLRFFLCGESKLSFSQAANSFPFPSHSPLYLLIQSLFWGHIISIILLTFLRSVEPTWPFTEPHVYSGASQGCFSLYLRILTP